MRTGAAGAVSAKYLSRKDSKIVGVIGTGVQGRSQLQFLTKVRDIEKVYAHSGRRKDKEYAEEMSKKLSMNIISVASVEEAVNGADIVVTARALLMSH